MQSSVVSSDGSPVPVYRALPAMGEPELIHAASQSQATILELGCSADRFTQAFYERAWSGELDLSVSQLSIDEAYTIQDLVAEQRLRRGEHVVGYKVGCTSEAIRMQFGLNEPISARLFHPHVFEEGVEMDWNDYANCAVEPEMVFTIGADLHGTALPDDDLIGAIEYVSPGIEIHNFRFWFNPPTSQELICSGGIHAGLIVGKTRVSPEELSFVHELFCVRRDGELITEAPASEIMGGPVNSLRWLVDSLTNRGSYLKKGSLVIPGSPVGLTAIDHDTRLSVEIEGVGEVTAHFKRKEL